MRGASLEAIFANQRGSFEGFGYPSFVFNRRLKVVAAVLSRVRGGGLAIIEIAGFLETPEDIEMAITHEAVHYWLWSVGRPTARTPGGERKLAGGPAHTRAQLSG